MRHPGLIYNVAFIIVAESVRIILLPALAMSVCSDVFAHPHSQSCFVLTNYQQQIIIDHYEFGSVDVTSAFLETPTTTLFRRIFIQSYLSCGVTVLNNTVICW
jgi:hypothetical protein